MKIWNANLKFIEDHNQEAAKKIFNFTLKINHFGDLVNYLLSNLAVNAFLRMWNSYDSVILVHHRL